MRLTHTQSWSHIHMHNILRHFLLSMKRQPLGRHPYIGYLSGLLIIMLSCFLEILSSYLHIPLFFPGMLLLLAVVCIALFWSVGLVIFTTLISLLLLNYIYVVPLSMLAGNRTANLWQLGTFALTAFLVTILASRYETTRIKNIQDAYKVKQIHLQQAYDKAEAHEQSLSEDKDRMEKFLSVICHELKTPLTIIHGNMQLADRKLRRLMPSDEAHSPEMEHVLTVQALLACARDQVVIQDRLVNDLLDVARIQAHSLRLLLGPCNLSTIVQEVVEAQQQLVAPRPINLTLPATPVVPVYADADRLKQVVTNYLTNALKYSPPDQPIDVGMYVKDQVVSVAVRDHGPGVAFAERKRIWDRFYRAPDASVLQNTDATVNLGIGLHLCHTLIEQHGGQVGVKSHRGEGAMFWFSLPLEASSTIAA